VLILAFDTSSNAVTVALIDVFDGPITPPPGVRSGDTFATFVDPPRTVAERTEVAANRHGELLAPQIDAVLAEGGVTASDLGAVAVGLGPGPFTGLRVGIVSAKAMGDALGIPVYGEPSLDVIGQRLDFAAYDYDNDVEHGFAVMSDARRKQVYWAEYDSHGNRVSALELAPPSEVAAAVAGRVTHVGGAGALLYREQFTDFTVIERDPYPTAVELGWMVSGRAVLKKPSDDLTPLYLRRPDAQPLGERKRVTPA
jgi:tRNA threonylcarbamoyl adenosine modification protein YeaZ